MRNGSLQGPRLRLVSRALAAVALAAVAAVVVRLRGDGGRPPRRRTWHEVSAEDLGPAKRE